MFEQDPDTYEISPQQAQAFVDAIKQQLPNLMPEAFTAEELVATWLSVNPSADPEAARAAFESHVALQARKVHILDGQLIFISHSESDFGNQTELRIMQGYEYEDERLNFSRWTRVTSDGGPLYTPRMHITDKIGDPVETSIEEFIEKAAAKYPDLAHEYQEFLAHVMSPNARVFNEQILSEAFDILGRIGPDTEEQDYLS